MNLTIYPGQTKDGTPEAFSPIQLTHGDLVAIVGEAGSGKSRLIKDIEQLANKNTLTKRKILLNHIPSPNTQHISSDFIAHLGQNMRFMLDVTVSEFVNLHNSCRNKNISIEHILSIANSISTEKIYAHTHLNLLSGGQSRALMIADISLICDSPIVLIDEIENAGINKLKAFDFLLHSKKIVFIVTHDPHTTLMAKQRFIMKNGGINKILTTSVAEEKIYAALTQSYTLQQEFQYKIKQGESLL